MPVVLKVFLNGFWFVCYGSGTCYRAMVVAVVVVELNKELGLPVRLALLNSICSLLHPLIKLIAILA